MSGPSLKREDSHSSIHEAALNEAKELKDLFRQCLKDDKREQALQVAEVAVEHWETRTLKHAEAEEEGLYQEMVKENPGLKRLVTQLTRDHDLMRRVVERMKDMLLSGKVDERMAVHMETLILVDEIHNEDEMNKLLNSVQTKMVKYGS